MATGTVKWFSDQKGYGFITLTDGTDVFVHYASILMSGFRTLQAGEAVTFDLDDNQNGRGKAAINVQRFVDSEDAKRIRLSEERVK